MSCIVCGYDEYNIVYKTKENFYLVKCQDCGLIYIYPQPSEDQIKKLYNETYYDGWGFSSNEESVRNIKTLTFHKRFDEIEKYVPTGNVLDVGCAMGFSLKAALERKWKPYGVELSEYSSSIAKKKFGQAVFTGTLEEANFESKFFDVIMMSDLIEHVPNPNVLLREANRILKPSGLLAITTPDINSLSSKIMRKHWVNIKFEHLFYFSPQTITQMLEKNGFEVRLIIPAVKALNLNYFQTIFNAYKRPLITSTINALMRILPESLGKIPFYINAGDMFVIAIKK